MRSDVRTETLWCNHLDLTIQNILKEERGLHKVIKSMLFGRKLHKEGMTDINAMDMI